MADRVDPAASALRGLTRQALDLTAWQRIPGWFDWATLDQAILPHIPDTGVIVEVGVFCGRSLAYLASLIAETRPFNNIGLYACDLWVIDEAQMGPRMCTVLQRWLGGQSREALTRATLRPYEIAEIQTAHSVQYAESFHEGECDFVFLDGDHARDAVEADCRAWWPKIKKGGWLAGHDWDRPSVQEGVYRGLEGKAVTPWWPTSWVIQKD